METLKQKIRKEILLVRKNISLKEKKDLLIVKNIASLIDKYQSIAMYYSINNGVDLKELFYMIIDSKTVYYPNTTDEISFQPVKSMDELVTGRFHIQEPKINGSCFINNIDVIIIPCLAVNMKGYRLGYGKGFYDRKLEKYQGIKIIAAYECQVVNYDFQEEFDIMCDYIVTEKRIIKIGD